MGNMWKICILAAIIFVVSSVPAEENYDFHLYRGQTQFALSIMCSLRRIHAGKNLFFSPHSIYRTLLRAYISANDEIKASLKDVLFLDWAKHETDVIDAYKTEKIARAARHLGEHIHFNSVDKFYVTRNIMLNPRFKDVFTFSEIERINLCEPEARRADINAFVKKYTDNCINELLPVNSVKNSENVFLVNAAFFKGFLQKPFTLEDTQIGDFYGSSDQMVEMMFAFGMFNYGMLKHENAAVLEMPYECENDAISMFIFLPNEYTPFAIEELLENLSAKTFKTLAKIMFVKIVDIHLPKISSKSEFFLKDVLDDMGIKGLFDFKSFNNIVHKTATEIREEAIFTETGASSVNALDCLNALDSEIRCKKSVIPEEDVPTIENFYCDHPFVYTINDRITKEILFAGIYYGPDSENLTI